MRAISSLTIFAAVLVIMLVAHLTPVAASPGQDMVVFDGGPNDSLNGQVGLDSCFQDQGDAIVSCP